MTQDNKGWGMTLDDFIEYLLRLGKKRDDPDFQSLILCFGKEKIITRATEVWKRIVKEDREKKEKLRVQDL